MPRGNPAGISSLADLIKAGVRVIAAHDDVPISKYAGQAIAMLAFNGEAFDNAVIDAYNANIVSREDNVGAVTSKIALGEGDAAVVYVTDAANADVDLIAIEEEHNVVASYAGAVLKRSPHAIPARELFDWIRADGGQEILTSIGFQPAP